MRNHWFNLIIKATIALQLVTIYLIFNGQSPFILALLLVALSIAQGIICFGLLSKWIGLRLIIIFIGGIIVLFLYTTSLSSNNKFLRPVSVPQLGGLIAAVGIFLWPIAAPKSGLSSTPLLIFRSSSSRMVGFLIFYLLLILFIATKISESFKGSLVEKL